MKEISQEPMTGWYDPGQLVDTGLKMLLSRVIGRHLDRRLIQALASRRKEFYDYTFLYRDLPDGPQLDRAGIRKEIWIDYIADTGDGWNSTYGVAYFAAQPQLSVSGIQTTRGMVLIFGGDEVYPIPSRANYKRRLIAPYRTAFGAGAPQERPHLFAIPGNHDWYDSLEAFIRLFCSDLGKRRIAGWWTRQKRSYFALKLPGRWWLLASDGQLQSDLDTPQIEYFRYIADNHMLEGDRVIFCITEPVWIYAHKYKKYGAAYDESDLVFLQREILSRKSIEIKVFLAGDLHHYRRHEEKDAEDPEAKTQKITAGGGGAFLHATHGEDLSELTEQAESPEGKPRRFLLKKSFPEPKESRRLSWNNLLFFWINPRFGLLTGSLYLLTVWNVASTIGYKSSQGLMESVAYTALAFAANPSLAFWIAFVLAAFVFFTDTHSRLYKWAGGITHCAAHFLCMFYIGWGNSYLCDFLLRGYPVPQMMFGAAIVFGLGWLVGSFLMGAYLLISLNLFGRHSEEAFSALKIQDYKSFLRLHVAEDGTLTIYPIKIERVARQWRKLLPEEEGKIVSLLAPVDGSTPELIEAPIRIKCRVAK